MKLPVYKTRSGASLPEYATAGSAAFDLRAQFELGDRVRAYNPMNKPIELPVKVVGSSVAVQLHPQYRALIPTGLIFDIPKNSALLIYPRSGMALKMGLTLANCVAVIDSDYTDETFVMLHNISEQLIAVNVGDRIAQAMLQPVKRVSFEEATEVIAPKTDRAGGLGSTGVQ